MFLFLSSSFVLSACLLAALSTSLDATCPPSQLTLRVVGSKNATGHWEKDVHVDYRGSQTATYWDADFDELSNSLDEFSFTAIARVRGISNNEPIPQSRYVFRGDLRNHSEALRICRNMNATLAVINSDAEAEFLRVLVARSRDPNVKAYPYVYLGFNDIEKEGVFVTMHGVPINETGYIRWAPNEPNNLRFMRPDGILAHENCGTMTLDALLNDTACHIKLPYICEFEDPCNPNRANPATSPEPSSPEENSTYPQ
ncbi:hypothetical protein B566_EDAN014589 [Ephemera danica]|nr:hypothetical protein B566_EDAN014589 [Ephemera danica]